MQTDRIYYVDRLRYIFFSELIISCFVGFHHLISQVVQEMSLENPISLKWILNPIKVWCNFLRQEVVLDWTTRVEVVILSLYLSLALGVGQSVSTKFFIWITQLFTVPVELFTS